MFALAGNLMARSLKRPAGAGHPQPRPPSAAAALAAGRDRGHRHAAPGLGTGLRGPPRLVAAPPHLLDPPAERPAVRRGTARRPRLHRRRLGRGPRRTALVPPRVPLVRAPVAASCCAPCARCRGDDRGADRPVGGVRARVARRSPAERIPSTLTDFSTFGACWILGMAHQEGILQRLPRYVVPSVAPVIALARPLVRHEPRLQARATTWTACPWPRPSGPAARCMLLLHVSPSWSEWPRRAAPLGQADHPAQLPGGDDLPLAQHLHPDRGDPVGPPVELRRHSNRTSPGSWRAPGRCSPSPGSSSRGCVVSFGWAEDLAAKRRPRLWPTGAERPRPGRNASGHRR